MPACRSTRSTPRRSIGNASPPARRPTSSTPTLLAHTRRSDLADLRRLTPDGPLLAGLKLLTRDQDGLIQGQTRLVNQLTACLKAYYPVALELFGKLHQGATLAFLRAFPTPDAARAATVERIAAVLTAARYATAEAKAREIWERVRRPHLTADPVVTRATARLMLTLAAQLQVLVAEIAAYDREISRVFAQHADSAAFASLPRAGTRLAPRLLAAWGDDRGRYADAASVQALAGASPVVFQSGNYASVHKRYV